MRIRAKTLIIAATAVLLGGATAVMLGPARRFAEFARAEECKGYWASLQEFQKQHGRYPINQAEINAFFHTDGSEPVEYVAPTNALKDEVILWSKRKATFVRRVGITEEGVIVKQ